MKTGGMRYLIYVALVLLLAGLLAAAWWGAAQLPAVRTYFDALYARAIVQDATKGVVEENALGKYGFLAILIPSGLCLAALLLGSRGLERLLFGSVTRLRQRGRAPIWRGVSLVAGVTAGTILIPGSIQLRTMRRMAAEQLGLAEPYRYVSVLMENGDTERLPAYMAHPDYERVFSTLWLPAELAVAQITFPLLAGFFAALDVGLRIVYRVRASRTD